MKIARKRLSLMLAWLMLMMLFIIITPAASFAAQPTDITDHWAKDHINNWVEKGLISGYPDGTFKPDNNITRAEFMALVNRAFGFEDKAEINYSDVPSDQWVADVVATAKAAGYISGYGDGTMKPNNPITRQEAAVIISRIIKLESNIEVADQFSDAQAIPQWSKGAVGAVAHAKIMQGYGDGSFKAGNYIKRAECVVSLNRAMNYGADGVIYDKAGTYGPTKGTETIDGNVTVKAKDTTLQNMIIEGDLVIHQAVGEGSVTLKKITVQGKTYINGGGKNSIYLIDSQIGRVYVMKESGSVRLVASGATQVGRVLAQSSVKLEESNLTGTGFEKVIVDQQVKGKANIELAGINLENLELTSKDVTVYGDKTTEIKEVLVKASDITVKTEKGTYIGTLVADGKVAVTGSGTIAKAEINVSGVSFETKPTDIKILAGVSAPSITTRSSGGGGGGGGSSGGDNGGTTPVSVNSISINQTVASIDVGASMTLVATVSPSNATNKNVTWSTSDSTVATVDDAGKVTGIKAGTATITVTTADGGKTASCEVTVNDGTLGVTRITAPLRADATGGNKLEYAYATSKLTISAPIAEIPSVKNPSGVEAKWIGVNIPKPVVDVAESGTIHLTIEETNEAVKVHEGITYGENDPFLYYFGAEAGGRTLNLGIVWNGTHKETLVVEYVDSTVVGEEPLEIVEVSFWNKDLNQILIKTNRLCSNVNYQNFSIDGVNADSYGQPPNYKATYGFWIGFPKDKLTIGESFTLIVPAGDITDIYGTTNKELTFVVGTPTEKITPVVNEAVTATAVNVGQTLAASILSGTFKNADNEAVAGTLAWDAPDTKVVATGGFAWTFTPDNTTKYNVVKGTVSVTVLIPVTVTVETTKSSTEFIVNLSPAVTGLTKDNFILKLGQNPVEIADVQGAGGSKYWLTTASLVRKQTYNLTINNAGYHFGNPIEVIIPGAGTISGNVKDLDDSGALLDVKVEVYADVIVGEGKTDAEGNYIITDIIEGIYNVTFSKEGYQSRTLTGVKVNNNETTVSGVDLEKSQGVTHSISIAGGTEGVSVNKEKAAKGEEVTVWIANIESGKEFNSITVTDSDGGAVATKEVEAGKQYTFIMPAKSVTIAVKLQTVAGAPAAPAEGEITITQPQEDAAIVQTLITMAETLEFRITNGTGEVVKQDWTPGTGAALTTTANPTLVAGDKLEVRVKAVPPIPAGNIYTYEIKEDDIGAASANATIAIAAVETLENYVAGFQSGNYTRENWLHAHGIDSTDNGSLRMNAIIARNKLLENPTRAVLTSRIGAVEEVLRKYDILLTEFEASKFDEKYKLNNPLTKDVQQIVKRYTSGQWNTSVRYDWLTPDSDVAYILEYDKLDICNLVILRPDNNQGNVTTELNLNMTLKDPITSREYVLKHSFNIEIAEFTADEQIAMNNIINKIDEAIVAYKAAFPDGVYDETKAEELREPGSAYETAQDALMDFGRDESDPVGYYGNLGNLQPLAERLYSIERLVLSMEVITAYIEGDEELEEPGIGPISDEYIILSPLDWELSDNMMATWITEPSGFIEIEVGDYVEGNITRPTLGEPDAEVTLTLTLSLNGLVLENNFVLTVLAINPLEALEIQDVAAESTENNGTVSVRWTPLTEQQIIDTGAVGYRIFYNDGTSSYGSVDVDNAREATCTIEGLIVGREYEIIVVAYNDDFYSIWPEGPYAKVTVN